MSLISQEISQLEKEFESFQNPDFLEIFLSESAPDKDTVLISNKNGGICIEDSLTQIWSNNTFTAIDGESSKAVIQADKISLIASQVCLPEGQINPNLRTTSPALISPGEAFQNNIQSLSIVCGEPAPDSAQFTLPLSQLFYSQALLVPPVITQDNWAENFIKRLEAL